MQVGVGAGIRARDTGQGYGTEHKVVDPSACFPGIYDLLVQVGAGSSQGNELMMRTAEK